MKRLIPAVLMLCQTHIVYVRLLRAGIRQFHRIIPEMKAVDAAFALRHRKERFPVVPFHPDYSSA